MSRFDMKHVPTCHDIPLAQRLTEEAVRRLSAFLRIEALSGLVLLVAAAIALLWANSRWSSTYLSLWEAPLSFGIGGLVFSHSLHFWINDVLMTAFFLVAGMEVRRELHEGALSSRRLALLPLFAAIGGVTVPALIYLAVAPSNMHQAWAVPTATDIAFAVGVLAILGKSVPEPIRAFLLALAIIDDIIAVLIIGIFYSHDLRPEGLLISAAGILLVVGLQRAGVGLARVYLIPGAFIWLGLLRAGVHPSLAGVILGLMTPVVTARRGLSPLDLAQGAIHELIDCQQGGRSLTQPVGRLGYAQREMLPPVTRIPSALHPWVAFLLMPIFALANAGVTIDYSLLDRPGTMALIMGIIAALALGKPLGIVVTSWLLVRLGYCRLPDGVSWRWMWLAGGLGGIGFTMSIFIANLAFDDLGLLSIAKLGVLGASLVAGAVGLLYGVIIGSRSEIEVLAGQ